MTKEELAKNIQKYLENPPLYIFGSGASLQFGLPSMKQLAETLKNDLHIRQFSNFDAFSKQLDAIGLESAIDQSGFKQDEIDIIRNIVWKEIDKKDKELFNNKDSNTFKSIQYIIYKCINTSSQEATFITTNYDRILEYAADETKASIVTGFEGLYTKYLEYPKESTKTKRVNNREKVINIWKVHGSLDWFEDSENQTVSIPFYSNPDGRYKPTIIPPSKDKYKETHSEPYRTIITLSDTAISSYSSYLCVGYGFNDTHIQEKLNSQLQQDKQKTIVVLAKDITPMCKKLLLDHPRDKTIILSQDTENKTKVNIGKDEYIIDGDFWELSQFITLW